MSKVQTNVYLPEELDTYVEELVDHGIVSSKSEVVQMLLLYSRKFFSDSDWKTLASSVRVLGEKGIKRVA